MGRTRDPEKHRFWRTQLRAWRRSGLSQAEFCRRQGLRPKLFRSWKRRLETGSSEGGPPVRFLPVTIGPAIEPACPGVGASRALVLVTQTGYRVEVGDGFAPDTLARLLSTLGNL